MKFDVQINNEIIKQAARLVMQHYKDNDFLVALEAYGSFNYTDDRGHLIADKIRLCSIGISVVAYTTRFPLSRVIGHAKGNTIFCNTKKFNLPLSERVENLFHELMHILGYSHDGNRVTAYNLNTVPFKAAKIFGDYLKSIGKL